VVVHWGERAATLRCLQALRRLSYEHWFLVVIDNGCHAFASSDVSTLIPGATCVQSEQNLGYTGGCNLGIREALRLGAEYLWFLNNDTVPDPDSLGELVKAAEGPGAPAIVGAKILLLDEPQRLDSIALRVELTSGRIQLIGHGEVDRGQYDDWTDTLAVTGCAMLATRHACESLGGFDDSYFAYLEDADFCLRARERGWQVHVAPRARVHHDRPVATNGRQSPGSVYYTARNHLVLMQRHGRGNSWLRAAVVVALNVAYALRIRQGADLEPLRAVYRGVRDYHRGVSGACPAYTEAPPNRPLRT
jgi:GT2 family glycosyltransferase